MTDVAGAHNDRVLKIRDVASAQGARSDPRERYEHHRGRPEQDELQCLRMCQTREVRARREDPGADGDDMEDADEIVGGRMVRALFVAVVEAVQLRDHYPERERGQEEKRLGSSVGELCPPMGGDQKFGEQESSHQAEDVRAQEHAPDEPAATAHD